MREFPRPLLRLPIIAGNVFRIEVEPSLNAAAASHSPLSWARIN